MNHERHERHERRERRQKAEQKGRLRLVSSFLSCLSWLILFPRCLWTTLSPGGAADTMSGIPTCPPPEFPPPCSPSSAPPPASVTAFPDARSSRSAPSPSADSPCRGCSRP